MAFRQPTHHAPQRIYTAPEELQSNSQEAHQASEQLDQSQEWILFSPVPPSVTDRTQTTSTDRTRRTIGRSRLSDYGSLETAAKSYGYDDDDDEYDEDDVSEHTEAILEDEEDGELDSLDSHLHEFRAEPSVYMESQRGGTQVDGNAVLPTHDGLGSFRLDRTAMGDGVQEHLYAFERYNPRRVKRRRESLELGQLELESDRLHVAEHERTRRIEEWRLEQSRALLDEIHKETRRRRQSMSSARRSLAHDTEEEDMATLGSMDGDQTQTLVPNENNSGNEDDSFWTRITRRVIEDLMGIDDRLLSIIFGESLPDDDDLSTTPPASRPKSEDSSALAHNMADDSWEYRLLERVARELGLLVNQLSDHPGAFTTYARIRQEPLPYAGLPIIPETVAVEDTIPEPAPSVMLASTPEFRPTIQNAAQPLDISSSVARSSKIYTQDMADIDTTPRPEFPIHRYLDTSNDSLELTKEEWEKQLDIKMVFRYLRSRFTSRPSSPTPVLSKPYHAASSSQDTAARAARVQQHHPLVRQKPTERRTYKVTVPTSPVIQRRGSRSESCASQSTRKSAKRNSGSSRHYWDINGSIGSGSLIASTGGMGSWGEV